MAEVGLVRFAQVALEVARAVLPPYRSKFSQPQLLATLCLMRAEDRTFRKAEVRLGEHEELRRALGLGAVLNRFLYRLAEEALARALEETVRRMGCPGGRGCHRAHSGSGEHLLRQEG